MVGSTLIHYLRAPEPCGSTLVAVLNVPWPLRPDIAFLVHNTPKVTFPTPQGRKGPVEIVQRKGYRLKVKGKGDNTATQLECKLSLR